MLSLAPGPGDAVAHAGPTAETVGRVMVGNAVLFCLYALGTFYWRSHKIKSGHAGAFDDRIGPAVLCVMLLGGFALVGLTCFHGVLQASTSNLQLLVTSRPSLTDCL